MAKRKDNPAKEKRRAPTSKKRRKLSDVTEEKPPESAENFEHALRRLISARDKAAQRR